MNATLRLLLTGFFLTLFTGFPLLADQVVMQNGDRLTGKVLSMSTDTVVLASDVLGKINVPRKNIATLAFGTNVAPAKASPAAELSMAPATAVGAASNTGLLNTNAVSSVSFRLSDADTNVVRQIREQMLAGNPAAAAKFDELADGLLSGKLNLDDLRRQARAAADQLRELKRENPEAADSLDAYLQVLDNFLGEQPATPATPARPAAPRTP